MEKKKIGFEEFLTAVDEADQEFVTQLHQEFMEYGCKIEVKEAKSGYVVSYLFNKKTVANYVFRKAGMIVRIYANHVQAYMDFLESLPDTMVKAIQAAPICKRLVNPDDCNSKCAMGYDFILRGQRLQRCRYSAFQFLVCEENNTFIKSFLENELRTCG